MFISFATHRLRFRTPFITSHGRRDYTDSVFVRLEDGGLQGYGEATLPPYVKESPASVLEGLHSHGHQVLEAFDLGRQEDLLREQPALRAMLHMAWCDLRARQANRTLGSFLIGRSATHPSGKRPPAMYTVSLTDGAGQEITDDAWPAAGCLKVKVGAATQLVELVQLAERWKGPLFLDANQGWTDPERALALVNALPTDRVLGVEQPFAWDADGMHAWFKERCPVPVFADESIQDIGDLDRRADLFTGLNIKLMKCGGLDRALDLVRRAQVIGMRVMLGCMSESSLGCAAMAALAPLADLCDLDGPWLIGNDPFSGLGMQEGSLRLPEGSGIGVEITQELDWQRLTASQNGA